MIRDTAIYPASAHAISDVPVPSLRFDRVFEVTIPGLPAGPIEAAPDGSSFRVWTTEGAYVVDEAGGVRQLPEVPAMIPTAGGCWEKQATPGWVRHLSAPGLYGVCLDGPSRTVAILAKDGTIYGRDRRHGHLLWRHIAPQRVSREGASSDPYLFVVPDASRILEALRWEDGSVAGVFRLDSEDASFASAPIVHGSRIAVLAVQSPRRETRLLLLQPRSIGEPGALPRESSPVSPPPAGP